MTELNLEPQISEKEIGIMKVQNQIFEKTSLASIVGKQSDLQEILILTIAKIVIGASSATTVAQFRAVFEEVAPAFIELMTAIESGQLTLAHQAKGMDTQSVIAEAMAATNDVATVFKELNT